jgi:hypothetical protein
MTVVAAAPTAADAWTAVGTITVPAGAKSIKKVKVGATSDAGAAAATTHFAPVIRLLGSGLEEQSPHEYIAPGSNIPLIAATAGYAIAESNFIEYDVDIPVSVGGVIDVQSIALDEVQTGDVAVELDFSAEAATGKNSMSQYVDAVIGAVNTWVTVGTITIPQPKAGGEPKKIKEIICGVVPDVAATAVSEMVVTRFRISGAGVAEGGTHEYLGNQAGNGCVVTGPGVYQNCIVKHKLEVPVNAGGQILVEQRLETEVPDGGTAVFGVLYE